MKIFLISPVRRLVDKEKAKIEAYVETLESQGHEVYVPYRDTDQSQKGVDICLATLKAIKDSQEVHVWYDPYSQGIHFDMGLAFVYRVAWGKTLKLANQSEYGRTGEKSFVNVLYDLEEVGLY